MQPIADAQLVCISNFPVATYSGMLPGVLAGQYPPERMEIDLVRLCASVGARLILDTVTGIDREHRQIQFKSRPDLHYDVLSIGIGSKPNMSNVDAKPGALLAIKPMQSFLERLRKRLKKLRVVAEERPLRVGIVGGGAGGVEIAFCLPKRIELELAAWGVKFPHAEMHLFQSRKRLVPGMYDATADMVKQELLSLIHI